VLHVLLVLVANQSAAVMTSSQLPVDLKSSQLQIGSQPTPDKAPAALICHWPSVIPFAAGQIASKI